MPPKGWKTVNIPEYLYDMALKEWKEKGEEYTNRYGVHSFSGFLAEVIEDFFIYEHENTPKIESWLLEDVEGFVEMNHAELQRRLRIKSVKEFVEDAIITYLMYCQRILQRVNEKKP